MPDPVFHLLTISSPLYGASDTAWTTQDVASFLGSVEFVALLLMLAGLVVAAALWGFGARSSSRLIGHRASRVVAAVVVGAAVIGAASHIVSWAFGFGAFT